jgi:hypothetical protein
MGKGTSSRIGAMSSSSVMSLVSHVAKTPLSSLPSQSSPPSLLLL